MKKTVALFLALILLLGLSACAGGSGASSTAPTSSAASTAQPSPTPAETPSPAPESSAAESSAPSSASEPVEKTDVSVYTLMGPTGMGMAKLMHDAEENLCANHYSFELVGAPTDVVAAVASGDADIAAVPVNVAGTLYNRTNGNVQVLGVNTLGVLYILSREELTSLDDLRGKTIFSSGQGATPEYILNKVLSENGIDPVNDVDVQYFSEHSEVIAQAAASSFSPVVVLPEPNVTAMLSQDLGYSIAFDMTEEWSKVCDAELAMGCVIARKDFAQEHPDAIAAFLDEYADSVEFVNSDAAAPQMIADLGIVPSAAIAEKALPNCHIVLITGDEMQAIMAENLQVLFDANSDSVGGALPSEDFYYSVA